MTGFINTWDAVQPSDIAKGSLYVLGKRRKCSGCIKHELLHEFGYFVGKYTDIRVKERYKTIERLRELKGKKSNQGGPKDGK
jgi:hypothetical protein